MTPDAPAPTGIRFSMLFPPGWREFRPDVESEQALTELATAGARQAGRADVVLIIRQHVHRMFESLRRRKAIGVHLPVQTPDDTTLPVSLTVVPLRVPDGSGLGPAVARLAGASSVDALDVDGARWYRWTDAEDTLEESDEAGSRTVHYVIPRPDPGEPTAALHLMYAMTLLAEDRGGQYAATLEALGHGIIGTFVWGPRA